MIEKIPVPENHVWFLTLRLKLGSSIGMAMDRVEQKSARNRILKSD
jgi:hypothetical protein